MPKRLGHFEYPYALENFDIWYAQGLKVNLARHLGA